MIYNEIEIAKIFNKYFVNIVKKLGLFTNEQSAVFTQNSLSEVEIAIAKYRNHQSIIAVTEKMEKLGNPTFGFDFTSHEETVKEVNNLQIRKVSQKTDIPVKIIKENINTVSFFLYHNFNNLLSCSTFPTGNYHPISILPNLSIVYERLMYNQIYPYFQTKFCKCQWVSERF